MLTIYLPALVSRLLAISMITSTATFYGVATAGRWEMNGLQVKVEGAIAHGAVPNDWHTQA
jgi:hypothetical protein